MNKKNIILVLVCIITMACNAQKNNDSKQNTTVVNKKFEANVESLQQYETPDWYRDAKFGIWNVIGPYNVAEQGEWYGRNLYIMEHEEEWQLQGPHHRKNWGHQSEFGYKDFIPMWKAEKFDADALMQKYKKAGAKYYTSIATFCDNFDLFDSKYTRWNSVNMGPHKDFVKLYQDAAHKAGLRYGATTHLARSLWWWTVNKGTAEEPYDGANPENYDLYHPPYDPNNPADNHILTEWADMWNKRLKDLIDNYELDLFYFDGPILFGEKGYDVVSHFYNNNLKRHNGNENGVMFIKTWPKNKDGKVVPYVATMDFEQKKSDRLRDDYWQTDDHIGSWGYKANTKYKETNYVVDKLIDIVSKNGNLLLCIPLRADGTHDAETENFLKEMGEWMAINGEAIYGTRPWKKYGEGPIRKDAINQNDMASEEGFNDKDIRFTTKDDTIFAFQLDWPADNVLNIKSLGTSTKENNRKVKRVTMVGTDKKLKFEQKEDILTINLPDEQHCKHALSVRIVMK